MQPPLPDARGSDAKVPLRTLAAVFLRLGATSFGGPAAHIALMEEELVRRRGWVDHATFLDLLGAANLIPGPNSTELAIHIGHRVAGWRGLVVAGACFILPAFLIVLGFAWVYQATRSLPPTEGLLYAVKPVVLVVVLQALWKLGRACLKTRWLVVLAVACVGLVWLGVHELVVLFGAGGLVTYLRAARRPSAAVPCVAVGLWPLFLMFARIGSVLFGSGYVLLAFLRADFVERHQLLDERQLLDAVAVGQVTPGPVFTTATFVGYLLRGPAGAVVATVGIFLPAFVFVALSIPLMARLRKSAAVGAFLDGVNVASLALMAVVTAQLARAAVVDVLSGLLAAFAAVLLWRWRVNSAWLILGAGVVGLLSRGCAGGNV